MVKCAFAVIVFSLFGFLCTAQEAIQYENGYVENPVDELEITTLEPKSKKSLAKEKDTAVRIECNVKNARVYLNKNYQGYSNLTIKDLRPGKYKLEVQKPDYKSQVCYIQVKAKLELCYFVLLEEIAPNTVEIGDAENLPSAADIGENIF